MYLSKHGRWVFTINAIRNAFVQRTHSVFEVSLIKLIATLQNNASCSQTLKIERKMKYALCQCTHGDLHY